MKFSLYCKNVVKGCNERIDLILKEKGSYEFYCGNGHKNILVIINHKFDLLFQSGIQAIIDGYYRESVFNFATSLERFYEYIIKIIILCSDSNKTLNDFNKYFKPFKNSSERQIGAFYILYSQVIKGPPKQIDQDNFTKIRNSVVHNGYIPTFNEAIKIGDLVSTYVDTILSEIQNLYGNEFMRARNLIKMENHEQYRHNVTLYEFIGYLSDGVAKPSLSIPFSEYIQIRIKNKEHAFIFNR